MAGAGNRPKSRLGVALGIFVFLLLAVVLPPLVNLGRYQRRIAASISRSIGRQVHVASVKMRLLPFPGFEFSGFSVEEKPEFGAEPILRSESVVAYLRLSSLWRGRLEVSRIDFDGASLNLVRQPNGSWNVASILLQAAHTPNAPTGQRYAGGAPRFPYIEATNSRINFKQGDEKKPLSLLNADLSIWLASPDEWEVRLQAQPARTDLDLDLADTGVLRIDGTLHRAAALSRMPLRLNAGWTRAPLGQLSRLALGEDIGWRGGLSFEAELTGTAAEAQIRTRVRIDGVHRAEFVPAQPLDLETTCTASYRKDSAAFQEVNCVSPVGSGEVRLTGSMQGVPAQPQGAFVLDIDRVPASAVLAGLQEIRNGLGAGLQIGGDLNGQLQYAYAGTPLISGEIGMNALNLTPPDSDRPFSLGPVHLFCDCSHAVSSPQAIGEAAPPALVLQPVRLLQGAPAGITIDGRFTAAGFTLHLNGISTLARLRQLGKAFGLLSGPAPVLAGASASSLTGPGTAALDLDIHGPWLLPVPDAEHPSMPSITEGSIAIHNAELTAPYLSQPLKIQSVQAMLSPTRIEWSNASIRFGTLEAQGALEYPTLCSATSPCSGHFRLKSPVLDLAALQSALQGGERQGEFLRQIFDRLAGGSAKWPQLSGTVRIGTLTAGKLEARDVAANVEVFGNSLEIRSLDGHIMNGAMHLSGSVAMAGGEPQYRLDTQMTNASPAALAKLLGERWGGGSLNLTAQLRFAGLESKELFQSAAGTFHWNWNKGSLAGENPMPEGAEPLARFDQWSGDAAIQDGTIQITHSLIARGTQAFPLAGTISFHRDLDLRGGSELHAISVSGTLEDPSVEILPAEAPAAVIQRPSRRSSR